MNSENYQLPVSLIVQLVQYCTWPKIRFIVRGKLGRVLTPKRSRSLPCRAHVFRKLRMYTCRRRWIIKNLTGRRRLICSATFTRITGYQIRESRPKYTRCRLIATREEAEVSKQIQLSSHLFKFFGWLCLLIAEVLRSFVFHAFFRVQSIW